jgi:uncharacterized protein
MTKKNILLGLKYDSMKILRTSSFALLLVALSQLLPAQNMIKKETLTGSWMGKISTGAIELRVVFNLSIAEKDSLIATLDSPDQGVKNIKLGPVTLKDDNIKISAGALLSEYNGVIRNDTIIEGTWTQAGRSMALNLNKLRTAFSVNRPQEPKAPFPYTSQDIVFRNEKQGINLAGTITIPEGKGPFPAVVMITGSGAQNRNEELMGHKPFLVIADHLSRNGIAVLRYDDRGVGKSEGNYATATSADLATDAEAAFIWLRQNNKIKSDAIGLIGHSEGGLIAPIVASWGTPVAFIVSLAGPGLRGDYIINRQSHDIGILSGIDEEKLKESAAVNKKLFAILRDEKDNSRASEKMLSYYSAYLIKKKVSQDEKDKSLKELATSLSPSSLTWMRYFVSTEPGQFWKKTSCPVLALNGEKDLQVAARDNLEAIEKELNKGGNSNCTSIILPGLNHLFQHAKTGLPKEYGEIEETFSPDVLKIITDWITGL